MADFAFHGQHSQHKHNVEEIGSMDFRADKILLETDSLSSGPFLHNKKFIVIFIPCAVPLFYIAGNLLFGVCVLCTVGIYLVDHVSKQKKSTIVAFLFSVVAFQFTTVYCLLPFIWKSPFNLGLVFIYNVFLVLSGGVGLLQFKQICIEEPAFAVYLEYILFIAYPITGQFVMTSVCSLFLGWQAAPFLYILYGFLFIRVFLVPSQPSFICSGSFVHKAGEETTTNSVVIGPLEKTLLLFNLLSIPGSMFIIIYFVEFLTLITWVKLLLCGFLSIFLCTCLDIQDVVRFLDIYLKTVTKIRWLSGIVCLVLFSILMWSCDKMSAEVLPLQVGSVILGLFIGVTAKSPKRKVLHQLSIAVLMFFYLALICSQLFNVINQMVLVSMLGLVILSVLCVASIWLSVNDLKTFNYVLVLQCVGMVACEHFFHDQGVYSANLSIFTCVITLYVMYRLYIGKIAHWQTAWICASIHLSKLSLVMGAIVPHHSLQEVFLWPKVFTGCQSLVCFISSLIISKVLFFSEEKSITIGKGAKLCCAVGLALFALYDSVILQLWILFSNHCPTGADIAASLLLLWGILCLRISLVQLAQNLNAKRMNIIILCTAVFIELFQPEFNPVKVVLSLAVYMISLVWPLDGSWKVELAESISLPWLLMVSFITCLVLLVKLIRTETCGLGFQSLLSFLMGFPVGLQAASLLLPVHRPPFLVLSYGLASSLVVLLIMSSWIKYQMFSHAHRGYSFVALFLCLFVSLLLEPDKAKTNKPSEWKSVHYYVALHLALGVCLKKEPPIAKESLEGSRDKLPPLNNVLRASVLANISVITSCLLAVTCIPTKHWEMWISLCACILLLWRPEGLIWNDGRYIASPMPACLFLLVFMYIGTVLSAFPLRGSIWASVGFSLEMFFLHCSLPSHLGLIYSLWRKHITATLQQLVVFCAPANVVLLVYCSTLAGRILGCVGIVVSYWIFYYVECPEWTNTGSH